MTFCSKIASSEAMNIAATESASITSETGRLLKLMATPNTEKNKRSST